MFQVATVLFCLFFSIALPAQNRPHEVWQQANNALEQERFADALTLYKRMLSYSKKTANKLGEVNALEAIALVYKKQGRYTQAESYCQKSIATGSQTYRAYYLLAQIAYEHHQKTSIAKSFCRQGLKRFPQNGDLLFYQDLLNGQAPLSNVTAKRSYHHASSTPASEPTAYLSKMEQAIISEMNFARTRPRQYAKRVRELLKHYEGKLLKLPGKIPVRTNEGKKAVIEAINYLEKVQAVGPLSPSLGLSRAARDHVLDQSKTGQTGHMGGDGSEPFERMERYGDWEGFSGENIAYGDDSAEMFVMQLIIDDGVPNRGHRDNMFNDQFKVTGVSIGKHPVYRSMCVITYATGYKDK